MNLDHYNMSSADPGPKFHPVVRLGNLSPTDGTPIEFDVGVHAKGFMRANGEWICYRRNYFSCTASYTLGPDQRQGTTIRLLDISGQMHIVSGFAIRLSAVLGGEDRPIQLVQLTPKRDKGTASTPGKVRLEPKPAQARAGNAWMHMVQHTFERVQFKSATPNNGRRPAPQKYYHVDVEVWVDVGKNQEEKWIKIGYKRSPRFVVRGRSPGHYNKQRNVVAAAAGARRHYRGAGVMPIESSGYILDGGEIFSANYMEYDTWGGSQHSHHQDDFRPAYNPGSYQP
ncbi:hypothetical protein PspLS_09798 [Pyricularia sp. CBS 133598]|nr:hypothetical protein PspLS_09798 [Pyricularia sp. CBS 133598]